MQSTKAGEKPTAPRILTQNMKDPSLFPTCTAVKYEVLENIKEEPPFMLEILDSIDHDAQFYEFTNFDNNADASAFSDGVVIMTHDLSEGFNESTTELDNNSEMNALSDGITMYVPESIHEEVDDEEGSLTVVRDDFDIDLDWVHVIVDREKTEEQQEKHDQETKRKTDSKNTSLQCDTCKKIFSKTKMKAHKCPGPVDKEGIYTIYYVCDLCPLSFKKMEELDLHKQLHASGFRYQCDLCDKWFLYLYQFRNHMRRHNLHYKRYRCEVCKKCFAAEISFNSHKMTHYQ